MPNTLGFLNSPAQSAVLSSMVSAGPSGGWAWSLPRRPKSGDGQIFRGPTCPKPVQTRFWATGKYSQPIHRWASRDQEPPRETPQAAESAIGAVEKRMFPECCENPSVFGPFGPENPKQPRFLGHLPRPPRGCPPAAASAARDQGDRPPPPATEETGPRPRPGRLAVADGRGSEGVHLEF